MTPLLLPARLAEKIVVDPDTGCWVWQASLKDSGYGLVKWEGRTQTIHRVVYQLLVGPIPDGLDLDHVYERGCRSRACCNPEHLDPVTRRVNILRSPLKGAATACRRGHTYTDATTGVRVWAGFPSRRCLTCHAERSREARARKRQAVAS